MKILRIEFRTRMIGDIEPDVYPELVEVEIDSTPEEEHQQIKEHYYNHYIKGKNNLCQTYPYKILSYELDTD